MRRDIIGGSEQKPAGLKLGWRQASLRMRRQQGRPQEAVALLTPILARFTEGFDTAELKEAKTLLDNLTEPAIAAQG